MSPGLYNFNSQLNVTSYPSIKMSKVHAIWQFEYNPVLVMILHITGTFHVNIYKSLRYAFPVLLLPNNIHVCGAKIDNIQDSIHMTEPIIKALHLSPVLITRQGSCLRRHVSRWQMGAGDLLDMLKYAYKNGPKLTNNTFNDQTPNSAISNLIFGYHEKVKYRYFCSFART